MALIVAAYALVATRHIDLPGIYADAINPDYLVTRILNRDPARSIVWVLFGNSLLGDRVPVLIAPYHGSQQFWLGLPLYALLGTSVESVRIVHATFALGVLLSMYVLLQRAAPRWLAVATCVALALDPAFSFSFRTQAYITVAPAAWIFLALWCLLRAMQASGADAPRWLFASGTLCGVAAVGYFVWWLVLPPIAIAAVAWMRGIALARPAWLSWGGGLLLGAAAYPVGYLLVLRKAGGWEGFVDFVREQQARVDPFRSQLDIVERMTHFGRGVASVLDGSWHSAMMFNGQSLTVAAFPWKLAVLVALPVALWGLAERRRTATPLQRVTLALPASFALGSLAFGDRLGGHHYAILVPCLYASLAAGLASIDLRRAWMPLAAISCVASIAAISIAAQAAFGDRLVSTGGKGFLSDAIHRFAADVNATQHKPMLWFPDAVMALPLIMLTHGDVEMSDQIDDREPKRRLCAGKDVWLVRIPNHPSTPRGEAWLARLGWTPPQVEVYRERDGTPVFEVARLVGKAGACGDAQP